MNTVVTALTACALKRRGQETLMQENVFRRYGGLMDAIKVGLTV